MSFKNKTVSINAEMLGRTYKLAKKCSNFSWGGGTVIGYSFYFFMFNQTKTPELFSFDFHFWLRTGEQLILSDNKI